MVNYSNGKIYKITGTTPEGKTLNYIGSTTLALSQRLAGHTYDLKRNKLGSSRLVLNCSDYMITLIELVNCSSKEELLARERYYYDLYDCVNKCKPNRTDEEKHPDYINEISRKYYNEHATQIKEQKKEYYTEHTDHIKEYKKIYRIEKADYLKEYHKKYWLNKKIQKLNHSIPSQEQDPEQEPEPEQTEDEYFNLFVCNASQKINCFCQVEFFKNKWKAHFNTKKHKNYKK